MLFTQNIYYCLVVITLIFLWGATQPHFLQSCSVGAFPSTPAAWVGRRLRSFQWEDCTNSVTGFGWPNDSRPRNFCWKQFPPHWGCSASGMSTWRSPPWREKVTNRRAEGESQRAILPHNTWVKLCLEMNWTFLLHQSVTSLSPLSLHDFSFWHLRFIYNPNARENLTPFSDQKNSLKVNRKVRKERKL